MIVIPHPTCPAVVMEFFTLAAQEWWSDTSYASSDAADQIRNDSAIAEASLAQVKSMLTFCVRGERFCDGHWAEMVNSGRIGAILRRLKQLRNGTVGALQRRACLNGREDR